MINSNPDFGLFGLVLPDPKNENLKSGNMTPLSACFREYCKEEEIGGDDQWYCNKCKEHRDITKQLEIFRTPKILCIQLKRFVTRKNKKTEGRGGMFNMAYAQIC
tara:strand:- start:535 stop:849 length:315 start_codon:yes stop_codon:yes gene_type:complete